MLSIITVFQTILDIHQGSSIKTQSVPLTDTVHCTITFLPVCFRFWLKYWVQGGTRMVQIPGMLLFMSYNKWWVLEWATISWVFHGSWVSLKSRVNDLHVQDKPGKNTKVTQKNPYFTNDTYIGRTHLMIIVVCSPDINSLSGVEVYWPSGREYNTKSTLWLLNFGYAFSRTWLLFQCMFY